MAIHEYVERQLDELDSLLAEWDERFEGVDLDRDEVALEASSQLLDEIERRQIVLQHDPRHLAACAGKVAQGAGESTDEQRNTPALQKE